MYICPIKKGGVIFTSIKHLVSPTEGFSRFVLTIFTHGVLGLQSSAAASKGAMSSSCFL